MLVPLGRNLLIVCVPYPIAYEGIDLPDVLQDFGGNQGSLSRGSMMPMSLFMTFGMFGTKGGGTSFRISV
jgi:hypothetical protein